MSDERARTRVHFAIARNRIRDLTDRAADFAAPTGDLPTVMDALWASLVTEDWDIVAEATALLGDAIAYRPWEREQ